jgi:hypothetical protein
MIFNRRGKYYIQHVSWRKNMEAVKFGLFPKAGTHTAYCLVPSGMMKSRQLSRKTKLEVSGGRHLHGCGGHWLGDSV